MIELRNVSKKMGSRQLFKNLDLKVEKNETVVFFGPSGAGKTVLIKLCLGLIKPDSGEIYIDNQRIDTMNEEELMAMRLKTGTLFQYYALFDSMTVEENVGFYLNNHVKISGGELERRVEEELKQVNLSGSQKLKPAELSGGMQKRVGIARAIIHRPQIVFYDAPTDGLDPVTSDTIISLIRDLNRNLGVTSLIISNDMSLVFRLASHAGMLCRGELRIFGTTEDIAESKDPYVYQFIRGNEKGPLLDDETKL